MVTLYSHKIKIYYGTSEWIQRTKVLLENFRTFVGKAHRVSSSRKLIYTIVQAFFFLTDFIMMLLF